MPTTRRTERVPDPVARAAETAWGKYKGRLAVAKAPQGATAAVQRLHAEHDAGKTPQQRMIDKIKLRMTQLPRWYEADPQKQAAIVAEELDRIGAVLDRTLAAAQDPVEVWQIPLSVFNWLVETETGESFVHGALKAWSSAEQFNASNAATLSPAQRAHLRAPFLELAPMVLRAVTEELAETGLNVSFAEKFVGPELKFLVMRVQSPVVA